MDLPHLSLLSALLFVLAACGDDGPAPAPDPVVPASPPHDPAAEPSAGPASGAAEGEGPEAPPDVPAEADPEGETTPPVALDDLARVHGRFGEALGGQLEAARVHTTASVNLRGGPGADHPIVRALPEGTLAVAFYGSVAGQPSAAGGRGTWAYLVVSEHDAGWASGRFVEADEACVPTPDAFAPDRGALVVRAALKDDRPGLLTVSTSTEPLATQIEAWELGEDCVPRRLSEASLPGVVEEFHVIEDPPVAASPTGAAGPWRPVGRFMVAWRTTPEHRDRVKTEWTVISAGRDEGIWHERLSTDSSFPAARRDRVRIPGGGGGGPYPFSIDFWDADDNSFGAGGEYGFDFHSRRQTYVIVW